jgi:hypothetical protein
VPTQHGLFLAALISDFPSAAKYTTSTATSTFLAKIAKGEDDGAEEMALLARSEREEEGFVSYDDPGASVDTSMTYNGNMLGFTKATATTDAPTQHCHTPPAKEANQYATERREVVAISDLTPSSRHSNRILEKIALAQNIVASQRKEAPIATALTGKRKLQSLGRKKLLLVKEVKKGSMQLAHQHQLLQPLLH